MSPVVTTDFHENKRIPEVENEKQLSTKVYALKDKFSFLVFVSFESCFSWNIYWRKKMIFILFVSFNQGSGETGKLKISEFLPGSFFFFSFFGKVNLPLKNMIFDIKMPVVEVVYWWLLYHTICVQINFFFGEKMFLM